MTMRRDARSRGRAKARVEPIRTLDRTTWGSRGCRARGSCFHRRQQSQRGRAACSKVVQSGQAADRDLGACIGQLRVRTPAHSGGVAAGACDPLLAMTRDATALGEGPAFLSPQDFCGRPHRNHQRDVPVVVPVPGFLRTAHTDAGGRAARLNHLLAGPRRSRWPEATIPGQMAQGATGPDDHASLRTRRAREPIRVLGF